MREVVCIGFGFVLASLLFFGTEPDSKSQFGVPNYSQTGLECIPITPGE